MRSKAQIRSHPLHPMLVAFPIAFLSGTLVFDAVGWLAGWPSWVDTGRFLNVAGIAAGLIAAVPGLIDYSGIVPPHSSARARATQHMLVNASALTCFALAWLFRGPGWAPGPGTIALDVVGLGLLTSGGWLGGTLVYRNQIGVDHRYAQAGKWREQAVDARPNQPVAVARADELKVDQMKLLYVNGRRIVLARTEQGYVAFDDRCTHKGGPLADGVLTCGTVSCPWHGSQFDVQTGAVKAGPAEAAVATYRVEQVEGEVRLILESGSEP